MTVTARSIIARAQQKLLDDSGVRWAEPELLTDLNAAQRDVVSVKPDAGATTEWLSLDPGSAQTLPDGAMALLSVDDSDGGGSVTEVSRPLMDRAVPGWHDHPGSKTCEHWMFDGRDPLRFHLYPPRPADEPGEIRATYILTPAPVAKAEDPLTLSSSYAEAIFYGVMARALAKSTAQGDYQKSLQYQQTMQDLLMGRIEARRMLNPRRSSSEDDS